MTDLDAEFARIEAQLKKGKAKAGPSAEGGAARGRGGGRGGGEGSGNHTRNRRQDTRSSNNEVRRVNVVPVFSEYKARLAWRRLFETLCAGVRPCLPTRIPLGVRFFQGLLFLWPVVLGVSATVATQLVVSSGDDPLGWSPVVRFVPAATAGGITAAVFAGLQVWALKVRKANSIAPSVRDRANYGMDDEETFDFTADDGDEDVGGQGNDNNPMTKKRMRCLCCCCKREALLFLLPTRFHPLLIMLCALMSLVFLPIMVPSSLERATTSTTGGSSLPVWAVYGLVWPFGWYAYGYALSAACMRSPPELNQHGPSVPLSLEGSSMAFYLLLLGIMEQLEALFGLGLSSVNFGLRCLLVPLPLLVVFGLLPQPHIFGLWMMEQFTVIICGGTASATSPRLLINFLSSLIALSLSTALLQSNHEVIGCGVAAILGGALSRDLVLRTLSLMKASCFSGDGAGGERGLRGRPSVVGSGGVGSVGSGGGRGERQVGGFDHGDGGEVGTAEAADWPSVWVPLLLSVVAGAMVAVARFLLGGLDASVIVNVTRRFVLGAVVLVLCCLSSLSSFLQGWTLPDPKGYVALDERGPRSQRRGQPGDQQGGGGGGGVQVRVVSTLGAPSRPAPAEETQTAVRRARVLSVIHKVTGPLASFMAALSLCLCAEQQAPNAWGSLLLVRALRRVWQGKSRGATEVGLSLCLLAAVSAGGGPPAFLPLSVTVLFVGLGLEVGRRWVAMLTFLLGYVVEAFSDPKQVVGRPLLLKVALVFTLPLSLAASLVASALSAPLYPFLALPLFSLGYPRPLRQWPGRGDGSTGGPLALYYAPLFNQLRVLLPELVEGGLLSDAHAGAFYMIRHEEAVAFVEVTEAGSDFTQVILKGLEAKDPTSCHSAEAVVLGELLTASLGGVGKKKQGRRGGRPGRASGERGEGDEDEEGGGGGGGNNSALGEGAGGGGGGGGGGEGLSLWNRLTHVVQPRGKAVLELYSNASVSMVGVLDSPDNLALLPKTLSMVLLWRLSSLKEGVLSEWLGRAPLSIDRVDDLVSRLPLRWYGHLMSRPVVEGEAKRSLYLRVAANVVALLDGSGEHGSPFAGTQKDIILRLLRIYEGKVPPVVGLAWLSGLPQLERLALESFRVAVKVIIDQAVYGEIESFSELQAKLEDFGAKWYIGVETDEAAWATALARRTPFLFSLSVAPDGTLRGRQLSLQATEIEIAALNGAVVRGVWASLSQELYFFTNDDDERYSIQANKRVLRNMLIEAADPPLGYPLAAEVVNLVSPSYVRVPDVDNDVTIPCIW